MNKFTLHQTPIDGLNVIERHSISDTRGLFERMFCEEVLGKFLQGKGIRQINRSLTRRKGTVRGLHFQHPPHAETKIVTCLKGKVFDVALDLRKNSKTFGKTFNIILSDRNSLSLYIPEGFAHAYYSYENVNIVYYKLTNYYKPKFESGINLMDSNLKIKWPRKKFFISKKDLKLGSFKEFCKNYKFL